MIILPQTSGENAFLTAERIRKAIEKYEFDEKDLKITVSGGVVELEEDDISALHFINRAENLLYKAKQNGRNRIER
jgi:diguanylate cyclase (GGDEF)-like protein